MLILMVACFGGWEIADWWVGKREHVAYAHALRRCDVCVCACLCCCA